MNRFVKLGVVATLAVTGLAVAAPAKDEAEARKAVEARSAHFKEMGKAMEPIGLMLRKKQPFDAAVVEKNSAQLAELGAKIPGLYEIDTREFKGIETEALDGIWSGQADFKAKADALVQAAQALNATAKAGDEKNFTRTAAAVGKSCGNCHDSYRTKKS
jgi:cytochrome c556